MGKGIFRSVLLISTILISVSCNRNRYNFTQKSKNSSGDYYVSVKGNLNENKIPNGKFILYIEGPKKYSEGRYSKGLKDGAWEYNVNGESFKIDWKTYITDNYALSYPSDWIIFDKKDYVFNSLKLNKDSSVVERMIIKENLYTDSVAGNFSKYSTAFYENLKNTGLKFTKDFSDFYRERYGRSQFELREFIGRDKTGDSILVFFGLIGLDETKILEVSYVIPNQKNTEKYLIYSEILLDMYLNGEPLFDRWGLSVKDVNVP